MRYQALLSPLKVGNLILKNRMLCTTSTPHTLQGSESYPGEPIIDSFVRTAKNGAAIVSLGTNFGYSNPDEPAEMRSHMGCLNEDEPCNWRYYSQLADAVHFCGSKISVVVAPLLPQGYGIEYRPAIQWGHEAEMAGLDGAPPFAGFGELQEAAPEMFDQTIEAYARKVQKYWSWGFDLCTIHAAYRGSACAQLMSPLTNHRTDKYGCETLENRARFTMELCRRIKELCGRDFPIELQITAEERTGGITLADTIGFAKLFESCADMIQIRAATGEAAHPTGWNSVEGDQLTLRYAQALKESGTKLIVTPVGGFQNPEENERYLSEGKCDMIGMARAFICDPEYGKKIQEGRDGKDIVPCIRCNRCHGAPFGSRMELVPMCTVNPRIGSHVRLPMLIDPPERKKRVAVVGGGPAGLTAALEAEKRGHTVTLFEASDTLGGQLRHADLVSFKWPLRNYKNYLIRQAENSSIEIRLNTPASLKLLQDENFDAVIAALGAEPKLPNIPGKDLPHVWTPHAVYGNEERLGDRVVVVGGASTGAETAIHLAQKGHDVTVLTRQSVLAHDAQVVHYSDTMESYWRSLDNFRVIPFASTTKITQEGVCWQNAEGEDKFTAADSVVLCGGVKPLTEQALALRGAAEEFWIIGDCEHPGDVHHCTKTAYAAASNL